MNADGGVQAAVACLLLDFPAIEAATRANPAAGISRFNVTRALLRAALLAVGDVLLGETIADTATGYDGGGVTVDSVGGFNYANDPGVPVAAGMGLLGWSGPDGGPWLSAFCRGVAEGFLTAALLVPDGPSGPVFAAVDGDQSVLGPGLFPGLSAPDLEAQLWSRLEEDGRFTVDDAGATLTPQIRQTASGIAVVLAGLLNDLQAVVRYNPGSTSGNPISGAAMTWTLQ